MGESGEEKEEKGSTLPSCSAEIVRRVPRWLPVGQNALDTWRSDGSVGGEYVSAHATAADGDLDAPIVITAEGDPVSYISRRIVAAHGGLNLKLWGRCGHY